MIKFTNPFTTIKYLKQDLLLAESDKSFAEENFKDLREDYRDLLDMYRGLKESNNAHAALNGSLRVDVDNMQAQFFKDQRTLNELTVELQQNEEGLYAHMQEREELLSIIEDQDLIIDDLEEDMDDLMDATEAALVAAESALQTADKAVETLNEHLVYGNEAYNNVVAAGAEAAQGYDQVRKELSQANLAYTDLSGAYDETRGELQALKLANTQSLSWVRQAEEALEAYGIRIEDTPVGPVVQLDTVALVNRVALDNVANNNEMVN